MKRSHLFRTALLGGYHKKDVSRYVLRLEQELEALEKDNELLKEGQRTGSPGKKKAGAEADADAYQAVIEESIRQIRELREENKRLEERLRRLNGGEQAK